LLKSAAQFQHTYMMA